MHEDFMWLAERFHKPEWSAGMASVLALWEPTKLNKYPHAIKYMVNPSERHVMEAACGKDTRCMNAAQIDAIRPGASQWFKMRKSLGIEESHNQASQAFRQWWKQGVAHELEAFDADVFEPGV